MGIRGGGSLSIYVGSDGGLDRCSSSRGGVKLFGSGIISFDYLDVSGEGRGGRGGEI